MERPDDDILKIWQKTAEQTSSVQPKALGRRKRSLSERLGLTLLGEIIVNAVFMLLFYVWLFINKDYDFILLLTPFYLIMFWYLLWTLKKFNNLNRSLPTLQYLIEVRTLFRKFLMHYRWGMLILIAFAFIGGAFIAERNFSFLMDPLFLIGLFIVTLILWGITELYLLVLYRKKYKKLSRLIREMQSA